MASLAAILFLIVSGLWAQWRFSRFEELPIHYNWHGKPTRLGSRSLAIWLPTTVFFVLVAGFALFLPHIYLRHALGPPRGQDPSWDLVWSSAAIIIAQIVILRLHTRWSAGQLVE